MAAMAHAQSVETPELGLYYAEDRQTLADGLNHTIERAQAGG